METEVIPLATEAILIAWSVALLLVHIFLQAGLGARELGLPYSATARDEGRKPHGLLHGRAERALKNFLETYPAFIGLALALLVNAETGGWGSTGAHLWFWGRIVYLPLYIAGVPYLRSAAWAVSLAGLVVMGGALLF